MTCFFFNDTATTEIYTLSLHDALPILLSHARIGRRRGRRGAGSDGARVAQPRPLRTTRVGKDVALRSEEHTSELQSRQYLVCRLLLEKKKSTLIRRHGRPKTVDHIPHF